MTKFQKNLMRTAALLLCSASLALPGMAQSGQTNDGPPPQGPGGMRGGPAARLEMMQKELSLTPDQTTKVKAILDDGRAQMQAARSDNSGGDVRAKMMELRKAENDKIKAVLDDTQKTKFEEMEKRMRERMRAGRQGGDNAPPPPPQQ